MNKEIKTQWVAALRSGKYKQRRGMLRSTDDAFCCLGVLCDVLGVVWERADAYKDRYCIRVGCDAPAVGLLPEFILLAAGLSDNTQLDLVHMNDDDKSFSEIADYIEANL